MSKPNPYDLEAVHQHVDSMRRDCGPSLPEQIAEAERRRAARARAVQYYFHTVNPATGNKWKKLLCFACAVKAAVAGVTFIETELVDEATCEACYE